MTLGMILMLRIRINFDTDPDQPSHFHAGPDPTFYLDTNPH
jgi:hypothetical protein